MSAIDLNQNFVSFTNQSLDYIKYEQNINFVNREQGVDGCYPNNGHRLFLCLYLPIVKLSRITKYEILFHPALNLCFSYQPDRVKKCKETLGSEHSEGRTLLLRRLDRLPWWQSILVHHLAYSVSDILVLDNSVYNSVTWLIRQCFLALVSVSI